MHNVYDRWPEIAKESYELTKDSVDFQNINHVVFAGMGGSGALGDIFSAILSKTKIHVCVVKGYLLPRTVDSNTLVVTTSISGDTVETLTVLESARKLDCKIIAFSSGGKMQQYCTKNNVEYRNITQLHSPRASFTSFLYSMIKILNSVIPIKKEDVIESLTHMKELQKQISSHNLSINNPSFSLAKWIVSGIPMIYYPWGLQAAAVRFKSSLQENAKSHAIVEDVLEASHNGIVAWERSSVIRPILLQGKDDYVKTKERWKILKEYFEQNKIGYKEVFSVKGSILSKLINLIYLLDYCTIYSAVMFKVDPSPVESINFVKRRL